MRATGEGRHFWGKKWKDSGELEKAWGMLRCWCCEKAGDLRWRLPLPYEATKQKTRAGRQTINAMMARNIMSDGNMCNNVRTMSQDIGGA